MQIRLEAFAVAREKLGFTSQLVELEGTARIGDLVTELGHRHPAAALVLSASRYALNGEYSSLETELTDQDTVSILPPVSGGAPGDVRCQARVSSDPISLDEAAAAVSAPCAGAVVTFVGTVRDSNAGARVIAIEYEAKVDMAVRELERIIVDATTRHALTGAFIRHRTGRVCVGEPSVVIATAAPHRDAAYAANRELLEALKQIAPIWKHEERVTESGTEKIWLGSGGG